MMRAAPHPFVLSSILDDADAPGEAPDAFVMRQRREARILLVVLPFYALFAALFALLAAGAMAGPPA